VQGQPLFAKTATHQHLAGGSTVQLAAEQRRKHGATQLSRRAVHDPRRRTPLLATTLAHFSSAAPHSHNAAEMPKDDGSGARALPAPGRQESLQLLQRPPLAPEAKAGRAAQSPRGTMPHDKPAVKGPVDRALALLAATPGRLLRH
jgi:hypothetical protein